MITVTFYSQQLADQTYGHGKTARTVQISALNHFFTSVRSEDAGWFGARIKMDREKAVQLYKRVKATIPDLIAEKEDPAEVAA